MSNKFFTEHSDIEEAAEFEKETALSRKLLGDSNMFSMSTFGYTDSVSFCKGGSYGPWGSLVSSGYFHEGVELPFTKEECTPYPYVTLHENGYWYKQFPPNGTRYGKMQVHHQTITGTVQITYNKEYSQLTIGDTTYVAFPTIIVDVQAAGGSGGTGSGAVWHSGFLAYRKTYVGGGGGGSGAFASFIPKKFPLTIDYDLTYRLDIYSDSAETSHLWVECGSNGTNGSTAPFDDVNSAYELCTQTGGFGGEGGKVRPGAQFSLITAPWENKSVYVTCAKSGVKGADGGRGDGGRPDPFTYPGGIATAPSNSISPLGVSGVSIPCAKWNTSTGTVGGTGEQTTGADQFAGSGGGAASLMSDGTSHGGTAGIGAGGAGGSAWGSKGSDSISTGSGVAGGTAAIWVYFIPIE